MVCLRKQNEAIQHFTDRDKLRGLKNVKPLGPNLFNYIFLLYCGTKIKLNLI